MTLTQLGYVVAVDRHRHFGKAAAHCYVSQPTLSAQIQKLEEELGVALFDRSRKPIVPTDIGRAVIAQARQALLECERIQDVVAAARGSMAGTLNLGVIPTLAPYLLPLVVPVFSERYPRVRLVIHEMITEQILDALRHETIDAGLIATDEPEAGLHAEILFDEPFVAYVAADHPAAARIRLRAADLSMDDLWLLKEGHCFRDQVLQLCGDGLPACGLNRTLHFESGTLETLQKMVDRAGGITLLPYLATLYLSPEVLNRHVRPFDAPVPARHVRLAHRRGLLKKHLIDAFVATLRDHLPADLAPPVRRRPPVVDG